MRLIDPTKTRTRVERTRLGRNIRYTDHHDGSIDAEVKIRPIRLRLTAGTSKAHVEAIRELEEATREELLARNSGHKEWARYATMRLEAAKQRVMETQ